MRLLLFSLLIFLASCGKEDTTPVPEKPVIPSSNIPTPEWQEPSDYDYSSSMTVVAEVDLAMTYALTPADWQVDTADLLAAFAGEECIGTATPVEGLFFLYVTAPSQGDGEITLRYYSSMLHNIFQADTILHFENGARQGNVGNPLKPRFQ